MQDQNMTQDPVLLLKEGGYSDVEVRETLQPLLQEGGFSDQEINAYFKRYEPASILDAIQYGLQGSVTGLAIREKLPDALTPEQAADLPFLQRVGVQAGTLVGDLPTMVAGGIMGAFGGPAAPVTVLGGAMALTEGMRAIYMEQIKNGDVQNVEQFAQRMGIVLTEAGKGGVIGGATGGAGKLAGMGARAAGAGALGTGAATVTAEVATMPTVAAGLEGRLPEPREFVDAAVLVVGLKATGAAVRAVVDTGARLVPKLRETYAATGKDPAQVLEDARVDGTVRQDLLSINRDVPERYVAEARAAEEARASRPATEGEQRVQPVLDQIKEGETVDPAALEGLAQQHPWARAALNNIAGPESVGRDLAGLYDAATRKDFSGGRMFWGLVTRDEAQTLAERTGLDIRPGYTHTASAQEIQHAIRRHAGGGETRQNQIPITREDVAALPEIIKSPDMVTAGEQTRQGLPSVIYGKVMPDGTITYVEEVRSGKNQLAFKTMWKNKAAGGERQSRNEAPADITSETPTGMSRLANAEPLSGNAENIISKEGGEVKASAGQSRVQPEPEQTGLTGDAPLIETYKLSQIIDNLAADLGINFRVGRMGKYARLADGIYKVRPEVARVRVANDIVTITHEAGHHIQKKAFGTLDDAPLKPFEAELRPMATEALPGQSALPEGFAEFVARYVIDPRGAREEAPRFYDFFEEHMRREAPQILRTLHNTREGVSRWLNQPAINEVLSQINMGEKPEGVLRKSWRTAYRDFIDDLHPLKKAVNQLAKGEKLPAELDPYLLARVYRGAAGKAAHFLERSPFEFKTGKDVGKPFKAIIEAAENEKELRAYLVAKRGLELEKRGVLSGIRKGAMRETVKRLEDKYGKIAQELYEYQDHVLRYYADAGMLDAKTLKAMREANKSYVPFYRFMGDATHKARSGGSKGFSPRNVIRRIKGSGRDILDPLESIVKNTYAMIEAAEKNRVARALADLADKTEGAGGLVEKLPVKMQGTRISGTEVMRALKGADENAAKAFADAVERGDLDVSVFRPDYRIDKKTEISVLRDGKRDVYQVDPELAKVINGLDGEALNTVTRLLAFPAKMLRAGATLTPEFIVRNAGRDALSAFIQSEYGYKPWVDLPRGLFHALRRDDLYWRWKKAGGDQATMLGMDRTTVRRTLDDLTRTGVLSKTWNLVKNPFELFRIVSELSEQASRLGEFYRAEQTMGRGVSAQAKAALASREVSMDFARIGGRMRAANAVIAFTNARIQGLDKLARVFKEHPVRSTVRAVSAITLPSVLLAISNYGDERIKEIPRWQHDLFWLIPVGDVVWRIPKPFELGTIFGSIPERITEWALDQMNDKERSDAFRGLGTTLTDVVKPPILPTALVPVIEMWSGKSFAFDRPIIPASREGMLPEYQYTENTTELAKALSRFVGTLPGMDQLKTFSPAAAENMIRNYTGGSGMYVLQGMDYVLRKTGALPDPVKPTPTLADISFVRAFVARHPSMSAESIAKFRERWKEADAYLKTINGLQKEYRYEDVANLMPYHAYTALKGANDMLGDLSKTIRDINHAPGMTADEKRQYIDTLYYQAITVARYGNDMYDKLKPMIEDLKKRAGR